MTDAQRYEELTEAEQLGRQLDEAIDAYHEHALLEEKHAAARAAAQQRIVELLPVGAQRGGLRVMPGRRTIDQRRARALLTAEQYEAARKQEVSPELLRMYVPGVLVDQCYTQGAPYVKRVG